MPCAGLIAWDFDHLIDPNQCLSPCVRHIEPSPQIDISMGFDAYCRGRKEVTGLQTKQRRLERDKGALRFVADTDNPMAMWPLVHWKSEQYRRNGVHDIFRERWVNGVVQEISRMRDRAFSGMLSALYAGDTLIAVHLGMRAGSI
jgi:CelD/BcsL family acetyltransferase involved in cellulose biosynthesis